MGGGGELLYFIDLKKNTHTYPTGAKKHRAMINVPSEKEIISNKLNYCGSKLKNKDVNEV